MERFSSTFTIGFRELFRIFVPGLLGVTFIRLEFPDLLAHKGYELPFTYLFIIAFFIGLITYILQTSINKVKKKPWTRILLWSEAFHSEIGRLDHEVKIALGSTKPISTGDYDAEYKYFLESKVGPSFVERVHYFTSFYYLLVQISQLLAVFGLIDIYFIFARRSSSLGYLLAALSYVIGAWIFHRYSASQLKKIINEQIVMVRLNWNKFKPFQKGLESRNLQNILTNACNSLLKEILLDPNKRDYKVELKEQNGQDWRTGLKTITYAFKVYTSYPISVSGEPGGYKGFYKERVESVLNHIASLYQTKDTLLKVIVEIVPSEAYEDVLESLIPLDKAYQSIIKDGSPVLEVLKKYDMKYVLVRGRHLVGPAPGLVQIVENICDAQPVQSALDLFSGTGIIPVVLHRYKVASITCVDNGKHFDIVRQTIGAYQGINCISEDAFRFPISDHYDLIVADPYYEDAFNFLDKRIRDIYQNTTTFVFVCCGAEDEHLRSQCKAILQSYFADGTKEQSQFGQSIFICNRMHPS